MTTEQLISARDVLRAIEEVRRTGIDRLLEEWERREPDLTEHLLEEMSDLHRTVTRMVSSARAERQLIRRAKTLALVLLTAQRRALLRHWEDGNGPSTSPSADSAPCEPDGFDHKVGEVRPEGSDGDA